MMLHHLKFTQIITNHLWRYHICNTIDLLGNNGEIAIFQHLSTSAPSSGTKRGAEGPSCFSAPLPAAGSATGTNLKLTMH